MNGEEDDTVEEMKKKRETENKNRMIYDGSKVNLHNIRATDLPNNKDIIMPDPVNIKKELEIQSQGEAHVDVIKEYLKSHCDTKGVVKNSNNMTDSERRGRKLIEE